MSARKKTSKGSSVASSSEPASGQVQKPFKISHSKAKLGRRCLKAYEYRYVRKLRKRVKSRSLIVGSLVHECLEMYFRDGYYQPAITAWKQGEFKRMFAEEQALHRDVISLVKHLMRGYIRNWKDLGLKMLWVEKEFEVEIAPGIWLVGKIDGCAEDIRQKTRWLVEHKSCKKMPGEEVRIYDTQVLLYEGVLPHLGEEPVHGVIWDYLRTKLPTKPALLAKGGLSQAKSIDTTRSVYEAEIRKHGYDVRGYQDILEHLDGKRDQFYRQVRLPLKRQMGETLVSELITTSNQLIHIEKAHQDGHNPFTRNLTRDCSWCDYAALCHSELRGEDTEYLLKHDYEVRKDAKENELDLEQSSSSE